MGDARAEETGELEAAKRRIAPILDFRTKALYAFARSRDARGDELLRRAVAKAEELLPGSLVLCYLHWEIDSKPKNSSDGLGTTAAYEEFSDRISVIALGRVRAGTLLVPTLEELAFFHLIDPHTPPVLLCAILYFYTSAQTYDRAYDLVSRLGRLALLAETVLSTANLVLELDALGVLPPRHQTEIASHKTMQVWMVMRGIVEFILNMEVRFGATFHTVACGLTADKIAALRSVASRLPDNNALGISVRAAFNSERSMRAAADLARHGLRRCSLPDCGATEPHPKAFKVCGRCLRAAYCGPACQTQDWTRHKREDGCKKKQEDA